MIPVQVGPTFVGGSVFRARRQGPQRQKPSVPRMRSQVANDLQISDQQYQDSEDPRGHGVGRRCQEQLVTFRTVVQAVPVSILDDHLRTVGAIATHGELSCRMA
jgi:hypothetical protein